MTDEIKVLDHGYVRLIDHMGTDRTIIESARMSTGKGFLGWEARECDCLRFDSAALGSLPDPNCRLCSGKGRLSGDEKLLEYLYRHDHLTPFEMAEVAFEVRAPIMVFREWHRHRTQSYNEMSGRYTQLPGEFYVPDADRIVAQSGAHKQGGAEPWPESLADAWRQARHTEQDAVYAEYERALDAGMERGLARLNLPVSIYSVMRAKTDLRNWLQFLALRIAPNAQWEIRQYAEAVAKFVQRLYPRTFALWENHTRYAVRFSRDECAELRRLLRDAVGDPEVRDRLLKKLA